MSNKANDYKLVGNKYYSESNYEAAVKEYLKGLEFNYKSADIHSNLSAAYLCMENYSEAREHGLFAFYLKPEWYKSYIRLAKALQGQGQTGQAVKCLEEGLEHVQDAEGRVAIMNLIAEYKYDPSYTVVKSGFLSKKSKNSSCKDSDSDYDLNDMDDVSDISKKWTVKIRPLVCSVRMTEDGRSKLHASINDVSKNEKLNEKHIEGEKETAKDNAELEDNIIEQFLQRTVVKKDKIKLSVAKENMSLLKKDYLGVLPSLDRTTLPKELLTLVVSGFQAAQNKNYYKAIETYRAARDFALANESEITTFETHAINYAINVISIELGTYDELVQAMHNFSDMATQFCCCMLASQYNCARIYYKLYRFKEALEPLESCLEVLDYKPFMKHFWPGCTTGNFFAETTRSGLKECVEQLQKLCRTPPAVTAICRYPNCLSLSSHIAPSSHIYLGELDFIGYVTVTCEEKCHIDFHINCWKTLRDNQVSKVCKISDKDMLGRPCVTEDCVTLNGARSVINSISITGPDGHVKTNMKYDPVVNKNSDQSVRKKSKKKRSKSGDEKIPKDKSASVKARKSKDVVKKKGLPVAVCGIKSTNAIVRMTNLKKSLEDRIKVLDALRATNFGLSLDNCWNPQYIYYGNEDEQLKKEGHVFVDTASEINSEESMNGVKEAKEFLFSYFHCILEKEGFLKMEEIEGKWKAADDLFDIKTVLPKMTSICDVLLGSTRFCLLDGYMCLSDELPETYFHTKTELVGNVEVMVALCESDEAQVETVNDLEPLEWPQAPINQTPAVLEEPSTDNLEMDYQQELQHLKNVYFSDDSDESEDVTKDWSDKEFIVDDEESSHNSEEEEDNQSVPKEEIHASANVKFLDRTESILHYLQQNKDEHSPMPQILTSSDFLFAARNKNPSLETDLKPVKEEVFVYEGTRDVECQTEESEIKYSLELKSKIKNLQKEITTLKTSITTKNAKIDKLECTHNKQIQKLVDEKSKILEKQDKNLKRLKAETSKSEEALKKVNEGLQVKNKELTAEISVANKLVKQAEKFQEVMQKTVGDNMIKKHRAVLAELNSRKSFCELQIKSLTSRCVEKITEYTSLLSLCTDELSGLHCWEVIKESIKHYEDTILQVNKTESTFQEIYNQLNDRLGRGEDVEDMSTLKLDYLPNEPMPLQLDKLIHNILERYEARLRPPQHVIPFQQNSFYQHNPLLGHPLYIPPPQYFISGGSNLNQAVPQLPDTLPNYLHNPLPGNFNKTSSLALNRSNTPSPLVFLQPSHIVEESVPPQFSPKLSFRSTSVGLEEASSTANSASRDLVPPTNNISEGVKNKSITKQTGALQSKTNIVKPKKCKPELVVDREPIEKTKKKKKSKQAKEPVFDKRTCKSTPPALAERMDFGAASAYRDNDVEDSTWQQVDKKKKNVPSLSTEPAKPLPSSRTRLLDTLKIKYPETSMKELEELVMIIREENGHSLSGLPIIEISSRVGKLLAEKFLKKVSSMGLEKFNEGAWGGVNKEECDWSNIVSDECTICLDAMKSEYTTLECNHIFHTKCIRQWLQEKSVCPLCIKFSTMPDEFPYLKA